MTLILEYPHIFLVLVVAVLFVLTMCLFYFVHCSLVKYCYLPHARKWCAKNGYGMVGQQSYYAFTPTGAKSEYTCFELECLDNNHQKHFVVLLVGALGVKRIVSVAGAPLSETRAIPIGGHSPV